MNNTKKNKRYIWSLLFALLLIGATFYFLFKNSEIKQLYSAFKEVRLFYIAVGMLVMLIYLASWGTCILVLIKSFNYHSTFLKCLKYAFVGFYYCSITPGASGGQPVQVFYMKKDGVDIGSSSLSILIVAVTYQIGLMITCLLMFALRPALIWANLGISKIFVFYGLAVNLILIIIFISIIFLKGFMETLLYIIVKLLSKIKLVKNADEFMEKKSHHFELYRKCAEHLKNNPMILVKVQLLIMVKIFARLSVAFVVYQAFGLNGFGYIDIIALQTMLAMAVEYLPLPGSIGAAETGFLALNKIIFGRDKLTSALLLSRGISFYVFLLISGVVTFVTHFSSQRAEKKNAPSV